MANDRRSRAQWILLGLACGDALGRPVEFQSPDRIERTHGRVIEMLAHGTHGQPAGTITDDMEMANATIDAVMMGGDTDTTGAVAGAVAGARFGVGALPERWLTEIDEADELRQLASDLIGRR